MNGVVGNGAEEKAEAVKLWVGGSHVFHNVPVREDRAPGA